MKNKTKPKTNETNHASYIHLETTIRFEAAQNQQTTNLIFRRGVKLIAVHRPIRTCVRIGRGRGRCACVCAG